MDDLRDLESKIISDSEIFPIMGNIEEDPISLIDILNQSRFETKKSIVLLKKLYSGCYDFNTKDIIILLSLVNFLDLGKLGEVLLLAKFNHLSEEEIGSIEPYLIKEYQKFNDNDYLIIKDMKSFFISACRNNHLELAKFLYHINPEIIHTDRNLAFVIACSKGFLEMALWLESTESIDMYICGNDSFLCACKNGHYYIAKWLSTFKEVENSIYNRSFVEVCSHGHYKIAKFLYATEKIDIHISDDLSFLMACIQGHLEIAQWLYNLDEVNSLESKDENLSNRRKINIHSRKDHIFSCLDRKKYPEMYQWLINLE